MSSRSFTIAFREFRKIVRSWRFLLSTFGGPFLLMAYAAFLGFLAGIMSYFFERAGSEVYGFLDESRLSQPFFGAHQEGALFPYSRFLAEEPSPLVPIPTRWNLRVYDSATAARRALEEGQVRSLILVPNRYMSTGDVFIVAKPGHSDLPQDVRKWAAQFVTRRVADSLGASMMVRERLIERPEFKYLDLAQLGVAAAAEENDEDAAAVIRRLLKGKERFILPSLLAFGILISSSRFALSMKTERESKMIDVLLSSVSPTELLVGKVLGVTAANVLQLTVWFSLGCLVVAFLPADSAALATMSVPRGVLAAAITTLGIIFFGQVYTILGVTQDDAADASGAARVLSLLIGLASYAVAFALAHSGQAVWDIVSLIPFATGILVPLQLGDPEYPLWKGALYGGIMLSYVVLAARYGGAILHVKLMAQGQSIGVRGWARMLKNYYVKAGT